MGYASTSYLSFLSFWVREERGVGPIDVHVGRRGELDGTDTTDMMDGTHGTHGTHGTEGKHGTHETHGAYKDATGAVFWRGANTRLSLKHTNERGSPMA
jgi:hypothetical protein